MKKEEYKKIYCQIEDILNKHKNKLHSKISERKKEMTSDKVDYYSIYKALGISFNEGKQIDKYQNIGRFLYYHVGSFLEEATLCCFKGAFKNVKAKYRINNDLGAKPKTFEIDILVDNKAYEIKWRESSTDGDHKSKEESRVKSIKNHGYTPYRIVYYNPNRKQAIKIQNKFKSIYKSINGYYYSDKEAWLHVKKITGFDLKQILSDIIKKSK